MSQLYKPPVRLALCSGRATARGAPTSNLWTKQRIGAVSLIHLNESVLRYWAYYLSRSPLRLCSLGSEGGQRQRVLGLQHTHATPAQSSTRQGAFETKQKTRPSLLVAAALS